MPFRACLTLPMAALVRRYSTLSRPSKFDTYFERPVSMTYKIVINKDQCVGHARCANFAPHLFKLDDSGYIATTGFDVPEGEEVAAYRGAISCPERVISMIDTDGNVVKKTPRSETGA